MFLCALANCCLGTMGGAVGRQLAKTTSWIRKNGHEDDFTEMYMCALCVRKFFFF